MLSNSQGAEVTIPGKRTIVLFLFATWCKFSAYEARDAVPAFATYVSNHHAILVGVDETDRLGVGQAGPPGHPQLGSDARENATAGRNPAAFDRTLEAYQRDFRLPMRLFADPDRNVQKRFALYFHGAVPTFLFVAAGGRTVLRAEGAQGLRALESTFQDVVPLR